MFTKRSNRLHRLATLVAASAGTIVAAAGSASAQQPPTPLGFVSQLDFECRPTTESPPPVPAILIRQLNPVLKDKIPNQVAALGPLEQMCVPVAKNGVIPTQPARAFIQWSDVACYKATNPMPVDVDLKLTHLNPVLAALPDEFVRVKQLEQVCVPVRKNASEFPPAVRQLVSRLDLACYGLEEPTSSADRPLGLSHLNPVIDAFNFPNRGVIMRRARQLCVPVAKNNEVAPPGVTDIVEWADFLKYRVDVVQGAGPAFPLWLTHLNPLFQGIPPFPVTLFPEEVRLMVPVAKNDHIPPGGN
jgi:hypothetical protein